MVILYCTILGLIGWVILKPSKRILRIDVSVIDPSALSAIFAIFLVDTFFYFEYDWY